MKQHGFIEVAVTHRPTPGKATVFRVSGTDVALFNVDGHIFAISDFCMCCGTSLALGRVSEMRVICSKCGWRYDIASGRVIDLPALITDCFQVRVDNSHVLVATEPSVPVR